MQSDQFKKFELVKMPVQDGDVFVTFCLYQYDDDGQTPPYNCEDQVTGIIDRASEKGWPVFPRSIAQGNVTVFSHVKTYQDAYHEIRVPKAEAVDFEKFVQCIKGPEEMSLRARGKKLPHQCFMRT